MLRETLKSVLFGSLGRIAVTGILALVVVLGGAFAAGLIGVPSAASVDNAFGEVNDSHTEIRTNVTVDNPNPVGAASADVSADYVVTMNDVEMARGGGDDVAVEPGKSNATFVTYMQNDRIPEWWASHVAGDETTDVVVDARIHSGALNRSTTITEERTVETDLISQFESDETREVNADQPLVEDPVLYINATRANWGAVDEQRTELDLAFHAYNPKQYDLATSQIGYTITMNGVVVGEGASDREYVLESGEVTEVETTTRIDNRQLDEWWVTHLRNDQVTDLRIEFKAQIDVPALGTTVSVPLDALTYEETIETDIWGNKDDANATEGDDGSEGNETADAESDSSDGGTEADSDTGGGDQNGSDDGGDGSAGANESATSDDGSTNDGDSDGDDNDSNEDSGGDDGNESDGDGGDGGILALPVLEGLIGYLA